MASCSAIRHAAIAMALTAALAPKVKNMPTTPAVAVPAAMLRSVMQAILQPSMNPAQSSRASARRSSALEKVLRSLVVSLPQRRSIARTVSPLLLPATMCEHAWLPWVMTSLTPLARFR